jgi:cyclopropane-fatty-acyl-phospholipid synthase
MFEHVGVRQLAVYFERCRELLPPGGRLLNHGISRPPGVASSTADGRARFARRSFIDRYVFPDGELTGSGRIITEIENAGFEVRHEENLREHYARTCAAWCANLVANWQECVAEAGEPTSKVWSLYLAGSRLGFEHNQIQLHQVLATKVHPAGRADVPLRPDWGV